MGVSNYKGMEKWYAKYHKQWYSIFATSPNQAYTKCKMFSGSHPLFIRQIVIPPEFWNDSRPKGIDDINIVHIHKFDIEEAKKMITKKINSIIAKGYQIKTGGYSGYYIIGVREVKNNLISVVVYLSRLKPEDLKEYDEELHEIIPLEIVNIERLFKEQL